jgi:hypothetical protein
MNPMLRFPLVGLLARHIARKLTVGLLALCAFWVVQPALGATPISGGTISSNTTWTRAASPYILNGSVNVAAGVTLTLEPGTVVKFNGSTRSLNVSGRLLAEGTADAPILFTSAQDDAPEAGGDTNGDGSATTAAPGQWYQIWIRDGGSSFRYAEIRYGAYGSGGYYAYGAVSVAAGTTTFNRVSIHDNAYSAIKVSQTTGPLAEAIVTESSLVANGNGISAIQGHFHVSRSQLVGNRGDALFFNLTSTYSGKPASTAINNKIASNGRYGVYMQVDSAVSAASWPYGHENNILNNNTANPTNRPRQLYTLFRSYADWSNNYWGVPPEGPVQESQCSWVPPDRNPWHLSYGAPGIVFGATAKVPPGPINFSSHYTTNGNNETYWCGSDAVQGHPFSPIPFQTPVFDFRAMTPAQEQAAALGHYRPYLFFDEAEHWQPVSVHEFLAETHPDTGAPFHRACTTADESSCFGVSSVAGLPASGRIDVGEVGGGAPDGWPSPRVVSGGPCAGSIYLDCMGEPYSVLFYNRTVVDAADGGDGVRSYWDYWWFYRYNDFTWLPGGVGDHEGDWEGMTVVTFAENDEDPGPTGVLWVSYAQHQRVFRYSPAVLEWTGLHPHGFPADGSHATYPYDCATGPFSNCPQDANPAIRDGDHGGELTWQQNFSCTFCVQPFPETAAATVDPTVWPTDGLAGWNALDIQWGGSDTPGQQGRYLQPWVTDPGPSFSSAFRLSSPSTEGAPARTVDEADCSSWFGPGIVAALCDRGAMQRALDANTFGRVRGSFGLKTAAAEKVGTTAGLAQAVGRRPVRPGETIELTGTVRKSAQLRLRVATGRNRVALAQFALDKIPRGTATVRTSGQPDRPTVALVLENGRSLAAAAVRLAAR